MTEVINGSVLGGQPGAGGAPASGAAPAAPVAGAAPVPVNWNGIELDADLGGWVQSKGLPDVKTALNSYRNVEKLIGAEKAGRTVVMPKDDAAPEEWSAYFDKLGRPKSAADYKLPVPDGDTGEFSKVASSWFHKAGVSAKQAEVLAQEWNAHNASAQAASDAEFTQKSAIDIQDLQKAWGDKFEANAELARRARRESGLSDEEGIAVERALGLKKAAEVFAKLGSQYAEAGFKGGDGQRATSFGATPAEAQARITALRNDKEWATRYINGGVDERAEFDRLHKIAYPAA